MVEITTAKKCEILFLNKHPMGPKMSISKIADFLSVNESIVASICAEEFDWTIVNDELANGAKTTVTSSSTSCCKNVDENDHNIDENASTASGENSFDDMIDKYKTMNKSQDSDDWNQYGLLTEYNELMKYILPRLSSIKAQDWLCVVFVTVMVCFVLVMVTNQHERVSISREQWIHVCKIDFFDHLQEHLEINKSKANILLSHVDEFYSKKHFTNDKHKTLLRAIEYQKRLKEHLEPLKRDFTVYDYTYHIPEYTIAQSLHALLIEIDDMCGKKVLSDNHQPHIKVDNKRNAV